MAGPPEEKQKLLHWYESTRTWKGGHSFTPFLENILRDLLPALTCGGSGGRVRQSRADADDRHRPAASR